MRGRIKLFADHKKKTRLSGGVFTRYRRSAGD